jgi:hypothetical protein
MQKMNGIIPEATDSVVAMMPGSLTILIQSARLEPLAPAVLCNPHPQTVIFDGINS